MQIRVSRSYGVGFRFWGLRSLPLQIQLCIQCCLIMNPASAMNKNIDHILSRHYIDEVGITVVQGITAIAMFVQFQGVSLFMKNH